MAFNSNITPGRPPLLWSDVYEAFQKVNENFEEIISVTGLGITPVDFGSLHSNVSPNTDDSYTLGSLTNRWKKLHVGEYSGTDAGLENGVWFGTAHVKGISGHIELPAGSTVNGALIIDPDKTFFKTIEVDNSLSLVADSFGSTVNLLSGNGVQLTVNSGGDSVAFTNTGILSVSNGLGITASTVSGVATITNSGVRSLQSTTSLPSGRVAGTGININGTTGDNLKITNTGVISISSGVGITVSTDVATGEVQITNSAPAVNAFGVIQINGDTSNRLQADAVSDTFNINSGQGITLTKVPSTDTLTITVNPVFDLKGSIFGDDSSILVDAVSNYIYGNVSATTLRTSDTKIALGASTAQLNQGAESVAIGVAAGNENQGNYSVALGMGAGNIDQGTYSVAVGATAGGGLQGDYSVAIGNSAGYDTQGTRSVAVGYNSGRVNQADESVAVGSGAGSTSQSTRAIAVGNNAGGTSQGVGAVAIGHDAGRTSQSNSGIAIGYNSGLTTQGIGAIGIGFSAGIINQGDYSIAIGYGAGWTNQADNSIILNASGSTLDAGATGFYVNPIRSSTTSARPIVYDTTTKELKYTSTLEFVNSTISTSDSSGITVDVITTFNSDIVVENDLTVAERLTVKGSRVINLADLKSVVAASTDFADFQTKIAALV